MPKNIDDLTFEKFPSIGRIYKKCTITEKIDGCNAQILITDDGRIQAGSRTRFVYPGKKTDNCGFAGWVEENKEELLKLGPGRHFGEWWGKGIRRGYGKEEKTFSLFNTKRWNNPSRPECCGVVPILYEGMFSFEALFECMDDLKSNGSKVMPGFMRPEGVVTYHSGLNILIKTTFDGPKYKEA